MKIGKYTLPPKHRVYDFVHRSSVNFLIGVSVFLAGTLVYHVFRFKTVRHPQLQEEIRLFKEANVMKEQVERDSMLMRDKNDEEEL